MKNFLCLFLIITVVVGGTIAQAQQPAKIPRIGYLSPSSPSAVRARQEAFRQGLRDLGYVEGKSISIEYRFAEGKPDRLPGLAAELVRHQPVPSRKQLLRFPLSWRGIMTLLPMGSSPASRDRAGTLRVCPALRRR